MLPRTDSRIWTNRRLLANPRIQSELITQLALLTPDQSQVWEWERAIHFIFNEIWSAASAAAAERMCETKLEGTWADSILGRMRAHDQRRTEEIRQHELFNSPEAVQARREDKRRLRQERHAERLAKKKDLDRLWFERRAREDSQNA